MLVVLGAPLLILMLQFINFRLRGSILLKNSTSPWWELIQEIGSFWGALVLPILVAIVAGMLSAVEHSSHAWKYILTMPMQRSTMYLAKLLLCCCLLLLSSLIVTIGVVAIGSTLGFEGAIPWDRVGWVFIYPLLGCAAIISIQVWLSTKFQNFSVPLAIGIVSIIASLFLSQSEATHWFPWVYPFLTAPIGEPYEPGYTSMMSITVAVMVTVVALWEFSRRDV